ncbi:hypothetical protein ACFWPX_02965 [Nocardia sp. NPDC058518]|uniref:hypothetical protein n=1 Tax=Nocardia sp. NPDC058518 TaxID=3346534 RepID=UPI0036596357
MAKISTGGSQQFAWAEREDAPLREVYVPHAEYRSPSAFVVHEGGGEYSLIVGSHNTFHYYQAQVVAYGRNNTRCKFFKRPTPEWVTLPPPGVSGWCTRFYVSCTNVSGAAVDSKFVFSFSGVAINDTPRLAGPAAFFETAADGTAIARNYERTSDGSYTTGRGWMSFNSSSGNPLPTIRRRSAGNYLVSIPGLGTPNPGLAQVTALGSGTTHCVTGSPYSLADSPTTLRVAVYGWAGSTRADTDFVLNYDQYVTRIANDYQGARAHADKPFSVPYAPRRSYNSGAIADDPGTNTASGRGTGLYNMHHSKIRSTPNSAWVGAAYSATGGNYCKIESWVPSSSGGTIVHIRCYDAQGNPVNSEYFETFQGPGIGPS